MSGGFNNKRNTGGGASGLTPEEILLIQTIQATGYFYEENGQYKVSTTVGKDDINADYNTADYASDGLAIQAAIDVVSTAGGGTVLIKQGTFNIAATINFKVNVNLIGSGKFTTILKLANTINAHVILANGSLQEKGIIQSLQIDGNKSGQTTGGFLAGIRALTVTNFFIDDCYIHHCKDDAIYFEQSSKCKVTNCMTDNNGGRCIQLYRTTTTQVFNNVSSGDGSGIYLSSLSHEGETYNNIISNNIVQDNNGGTPAIELRYGSNNNIISNNQCLRSSNEGINVNHNSQNNIVIGNTCQDNQYFQIELDNNANSFGTIVSNNICSGAVVYGGIHIFFSSGAVVTGNYVYSNHTRGIDIDRSYYCQINNNIVSGNTDVGIVGFMADFLTISSNTVINNGSNAAKKPGIIVGSMSNATITNNTISDTNAVGSEVMSVGISNNANPDYCIVTHNKIKTTQTHISMGSALNNDISHNIEV